MLNIKFHGNQPSGSVKEDFLSVFTIYGHVCHLGYETSIMSSDFHFHVTESFHTKLVQIGTVVSEKIQLLNFHMYMTLCQGQEMTLTFNTHLPS